MANSSNARKNVSKADSLVSPPEVSSRYAEFRKLLLHRRNEIIRQTQRERSELDEQVMTAPGDVGDQSVIDAAADFLLQLADNERKEMMEIRDALLRMQRGTYGVCESCENPIPPERLEKLPQARLCVDCQSTAESKYRTSRPQAVPKL